jgi:hypothetical protein
MTCRVSWPRADKQIVSAVLAWGGGLPHARGHIALVWLGRCHASPDRVFKGALSDRDARGVVTGGLWMVSSQRFLAMLGAPLAGVGGVDGDHADLGLGRHREQSGTEVDGFMRSRGRAEPQVGAKGIDGVGRFILGTGEVGYVLVSVKGGKNHNPAMVGDLAGTVKTQGACVAPR